MAQDVKLATHIHRVLVVRPRGAVPTLTHMPYGVQEAKIITVFLLLPH